MKTNKSFEIAALMAASMLMACTRQEAEPAATAAPAAAEITEEFAPEGLPPHLENRVEAAREALAGGENVRVSFQMISRLKVWPPEESVLRVCFFRGNAALRDRIVKVAQRWLTRPVGISLDFGAAPGYRNCLRTGNDHIRVGFNYAGNWSLVGQDSYVHANQDEQSMNFQGFLVRTPSEKEFTRLVLHEFGHALGFEHEHQHPWSRCETQFDMPAIERELAGPPNYWDRETITHNMMVESADDKTLSTFDPKSVMLYHFPERFYLNGSASTCYTEGNYALSTGDLDMLVRIYPLEQQQRVAALTADVNTYLTALKGESEAAPGMSQAQDVAALSELVKMTDGKLPKSALRGLSVQQLPKELRDARPLQ